MNKPRNPIRVILAMDISMPGLNGLEAAERMVRENPEVRILILSMHQNEEYYWPKSRAFQWLKELIADGYLFVYQDLRGKFKSEGQFVIGLCT